MVLNTPEEKVYSVTGLPLSRTTTCASTTPHACWCALAWVLLLLTPACKEVPGPSHKRGHAWLSEPRCLPISRVAWLAAPGRESQGCVRLADHSTNRL